MLQFFEVANRACEAVAGNVVRMYEVVRECRRIHQLRNRRRLPSLRRVTFPVARALSNEPDPIVAPLPPQVVDGLLADRKRKASDSPLPMSRAKRHDNGLTKISPWDNEDWLQQKFKKPEPTNETEHYHTAARKLILTKHRQRRPARRLNRWNPYKFRRTISPKPAPEPRISLFLPRPDRWEGIYDASDDESETSPIPPIQASMPAQEESVHMEIDELALQTADFTPIKLSDSDVGVKHETPTKVVSEEEEEQTSAKQAKATEGEEEDEWAWDKEGEADYRKLLRSMPESHDDEGYKVPIDGWISPETQAWNDNHRRELLREAALAQQTPSRPPKYRAPSVASYNSDDSADEIALSPVAKVESSAKSKATTQSPAQEKSEEGDAEPTVTTPIAKQVDFMQEEVKKESTSPTTRNAKTESASTPDVKTDTKTPTTTSILSKIKNLSLGSKDFRTPKSKVYENWKSERRTRTQKYKADLEAAKNQYPIVPLSKDWESRVRHAVNHGHERFEARMFSKCVPEFSNDPSAGSLWLDDAVINDYVTMVAKHGSKADRPTQVPTVAALSSYFYSKISDSAAPNYSSCARMLKRAGVQGKNILQCEKIFLPINKSYHWTLAVIEPKVPEGVDPTNHKRKITIYNSMGSSGGQQVANNIYKWLQWELGASFKEEEWEIDPVGTSPQQRNSDDCGVFTVTTARQIMLGKYAPDMYPADVIGIQRRRIVAELVNGALLNKDESET